MAIATEFKLVVHIVHAIYLNFSISLERPKLETLHLVRLLSTTKSRHTICKCKTISEGPESNMTCF